MVKQNTIFSCKIKHQAKNLFPSDVERTVVQWQTVQNLIRLLLKEQSDLGLHCLHMLFLVRNLGVQNFRTFTIIKQIGTDKSWS